MENKLMASNRTKESLQYKRIIEDRNREFQADKVMVLVKYENTDNENWKAE